LAGGLALSGPAEVLTALCAPSAGFFVKGLRPLKLMRGWEKEEKGKRKGNRSAGRTGRIEGWQGGALPQYL